MVYVTVTLSQLVDRALLELQAPSENGFRVVVGSVGLDTAGSTTFTLTDPDRVAPTDLIEFGSELVLVTGKTDDAVPVYTCARGYYGTAAGAAPSGTVGVVNPTYPRHRVAEAVRRSFARLEAFGVTPVRSGTFTRPAGKGHVLMPAGTKEVYDVWYLSDDGRLHDLDRWQFDHSLPTGKFATGCAIRLPYYVSDTDELEIRYRGPYRWSTFPDPPTMGSTIEIPEGAEDLPALYAAAWMVASREISRNEIDRSEEWQRTEALGDRGSPGAFVRAQWQSFYRALDEARRINHVPARRHYVRMPKVR